MGGGGEISRASTGLLGKRVEFELSSEGVSLVTIERVWQMLFGWWHFQVVAQMKSKGS